MPQRSRAISTGPSIPATRSSPSVFGSGRLKSCHQSPAAVVPNSPPTSPSPLAPPRSRPLRSIAIRESSQPSVGEVWRELPVGVQLLQVGLHHLGRRRQQRLGHVVPDILQERVPRALAARERLQQPAL